MSAEPLVIEVHGLAFFAHHGVRELEQRQGQRFLLDLLLVPRSDAACESDRLEDAVSYSAAADIALVAATAERHDLIERVAAVVADALLARLPLARVTVTVHKPSAPVRPPVADVTVTVSRSAPPP